MESAAEYSVTVTRPDCRMQYGMRLSFGVQVAQGKEDL